MNHSHRTHPLFTTRLSSLLVAALVVICGIGGSRLLGISSAATYYSNHPYGRMDSCKLSGSTTYIYGWANDPQASEQGKSVSPYVTITVAGTAKKVPTNISGYRDADINAYIHQSYPHQPTSGEYGFVASFGGLYKGTQYHVAGIATDVGGTENTALSLNTSSSVGGLPYFGGSIIPDSCLNARPTPPPVTPPPAPKPPATPTKPRSGGTTTTTTPASPANPSGPSNAADGTATVGTTSAIIKFPIGGASKAHVIYSVDNGPSLSSPDEAVGGDTVSVIITGLQPKSTYNYQLVRTNGANVTSTSGATSFDTTGYIISVTFEDGGGKPVKGIVGQLNDSHHTKATSDKNGALTFKDLDSGTYTVSFDYQGQKHSLDYDTNSSAGNGTDGGPTTLADTIDVSQFTADGNSSKGGSPIAIIAVIIFILLVGLGVAGWFIFRALRNRRDPAVVPLPAAPPVPVTASQDIIDQKMLTHFKNNPPPVATAQPEHINESLREMVVRSMHEQASKRQQDADDPQDPKPPVVPGQQ